jgi:hypothetical protein
VSVTLYSPFTVSSIHDGGRNIPWQQPQHLTWHKIFIHWTKMNIPSVHLQVKSSIWNMRIRRFYTETSQINIV